MLEVDYSAVLNDSTTASTITAYTDDCVAMGSLPAGVAVFVRWSARPSTHASLYGPGGTEIAHQRAGESGDWQVRWIEDFQHA